MQNLLAVNATRVRNALQWLKAHNPLYQDMVINEECLQQLEETPVLPFNIEHVRSSAANETATSRYDSTPVPDHSSQQPDESIPFQNIVITDIECHASSNELRAAALRHVQKKGGGYIQIPHDHDAENEFRKDGFLFPLMYPTLFPYGLRGPSSVAATSDLAPPSRLEPSQVESFDDFTATSKSSASRLEPTRVT
jgi:hypothetical protein